MKTYIKKPVAIKAIQWFKDGDHLGVFPLNTDRIEFKCLCGATHFEHGMVDTLEGHHIVCPGDWVIQGVENELYPCKPSIFAKTYYTEEEYAKLGTVP